MSIFSIVHWWTWLLATFGIAGVVLLIVLAFAAPWLAARLALWFGERAANVIIAVLKHPLGAAVVAGSLMYAVGAIHTAHVAAGKCEQTIERLREEAAAERQAHADEAAETQRQADQRVADLLAEQDTKSKETIRALQQQIDESKPGPTALFDARCRVTPTGVRAFAGE